MRNTRLVVRILAVAGLLKELAEVSVNGKPVGTLRTPPFRADVTEALKRGVNRLEIKVTNLVDEPHDRRQGAAQGEALHVLDYDPYDKTSPFGRRTGEKRPRRRGSWAGDGVVVGAAVRRTWQPER